MSLLLDNLVQIQGFPDVVGAEGRINRVSARPACRVVNQVLCLPKHFRCFQR